MAKKSSTLFRILKDIRKFPKIHASRIVTEQLLRSCGSISANIAEGFGRKKGKEYIHYLIIARGSTTETLNWLLKCVDAKWLDKETYYQRERTLEEILKMLNRMIGQKIRS